jgi:ketopantoate hydroxymethyltransferase
MSATAIAPTATQQINNYIEKKIDFSKEMTPEQHKEHAVNLMNLRFATTIETSGGKRKKPKTEKLKRKRIRVKKDVDAI